MLVLLGNESSFTFCAFMTLINSSIYKEVIRPFFKLFIFFYDKIPQGKKALKGTINILVFSR